MVPDLRERSRSGVVCGVVKRRERRKGRERGRSRGHAPADWQHALSYQYAGVMASDVTASASLAFVQLADRSRTSR